MKLNLSGVPIAVDLLTESLGRTGSVVIPVNGNSMHPTLQMGWRIFLEPVNGAGLRVGQIGVFRAGDHLMVHRLIWREPHAGGETLVFRGDYNRVRERVDPSMVIARVVAVEVPGRTQGQGRILELGPDLLARFYRVCYGLSRLFRPILPAGRPGPPGPLGRAARAVFAAAERFVSYLLPARR